jgi:hypothetical protein
MRLVAVAIVKNEADVIEAFVRHTLAWVDHLFILDHESTDGTREILQALRAEGLPLRLFTDDALGHIQEYRSNYLSRLAVRELQADWIVPLDADEFLCGLDRAALEADLAASHPGHARSLTLLNYLYTDADDRTEANPVLRLQHCEPQRSPTRKVMVSAALTRDESVTAIMGSHALVRDGQKLPDQPLNEAFHLAHYPLRSPEHQLLRIVFPQLQKFSHGKTHEDIGTHNRLGFQLLAEDPDLFLAVTQRPAASLRRQPIRYRGTALRHSAGRGGWQRIARSIIPYLEKLAMSHGRLVDQLGPTETVKTTPVIHEIGPSFAGVAGVATLGFGGYTAKAGLGPPEGPVPEAFLPVFHWGYAPATTLVVDSPAAGTGRLVTDLLSYSLNQTVTITLNGVELHRQTLARINQKERLAVALPLRAGANELVIAYTECLVTDYDARKLAAIFLSLRVLPA